MLKRERRTAVVIEYLSSGKLPCVYLQNSGLGNYKSTISIAHKQVYNIPLLL